MFEVLGSIPPVDVIEAAIEQFFMARGADAKKRGEQAFVVAAGKPSFFNSSGFLRILTFQLSIEFGSCSCVGCSTFA